MQFRQTIYTSDLEYQLMDVDGVRSVNFVELTQDFNELLNTDSIIADGNNIRLYDKEFSLTDGSVTDYSNDDEYHTGNYGWKYDFSLFYTKNCPGFVRNGVILPPKEPAVFELKFPNVDIEGRVVGDSAGSPGSSNGGSY